MDVLSDVLQVIRLSGAALFRASLGAPWALISSGTDSVMRQFPMPVRRVTVFHVVIRGSCWVQRVSGPPQRLTAGDAVVLPRCDVHVLADEPGRKPVPTAEMLHGTPIFKLRDVTFGGEGGSTQLLCGFLICEQTDFEPLFAALPPLFRLSFRGGQGLPDLESLIEYAVHEAISEGAGAASSRLRAAELLFVEALRRYMVGLGPDDAGWLAGLRDPVIGKALALMHEQPCYPWTVTELAGEVALSRSALAGRFSTLLGEPPMHYLARWRLVLAARQLRDSHRSVAAIAESIGYESSAAFQRAFKRIHGETPAACRKRLQRTA
ncbi:MAG TPA: AraC family transcriptional regulator [Gammaproteobacteria bacterium]|jgi:AraC-like DNA-binding protein|nr:AraC family transcriptional regulator [Gammaproteobacteria bacterium]HET7587976.1 AraC family transcriptional regulator [Gammaproteobacteria bacterium]